MRYAIIENGIVANIALADAPLAENWIELPEDSEAQIGWTYARKKFTAPPPPPPIIPSSVTPRQARLALAWAASPDPAYPHMLGMVEALFDGLPEPQKTVAKISWEYSTVIERSNPLIAQLQTLVGLTDEEIDALFIAASKL
ncbi:MAG: hypothetical protein RSE12_16900 [Fuscovulum sp.]|nr:MAG: hypothetical protein RSE12_16900 [Fuscovulum sp.]